MPIQKITTGVIDSIANTQISGNIVSSQITSVANTQITGNIIASQIAAVNASTVTTGTLPSARLGSDVMVSGNMPAFSAYASTATSISGGVYTKVTQNVEEFDTNNNFASSRFTPTVAGYYQVNAGSNTPASNYANSAIFKNGSVYKSGTNGSGAVNSSCVSTLVYLNGSTDYVEFYFINGSSVTLGTGAENCYFNGCLVRSA